MWSDILSKREADYTRKALDSLANVTWAKPLLSRIKNNRGMRSETMPLLFEVRFAYELLLVGFSAQYEYPTGIGDSTVEFKLNTSPPWLIELVSIRESLHLKEAIVQDGDFYELELSTNAKNKNQSEEAEMIRVGIKIGEKVLHRNNPTKFPLPHNTYHLILVDMRGYLGSGGDHFDYEQIAYGALKNNPYTHFWNGEPIKGLFEETNDKLKAARLLQERIHSIGFIKERDYYEGEIRDKAFYTYNLNLINNRSEFRRIWQAYPLKITNNVR